MTVVIYFCMYFKYNFLLSTFTQVYFCLATSTSTGVDFCRYTSTFTQVEKKSTCYSSAHRLTPCSLSEWRSSLRGRGAARKEGSRAKPLVYRSAIWWSFYSKNISTVRSTIIHCDQVAINFLLGPHCIFRFLVKSK